VETCDLKAEKTKSTPKHVTCFRKPNSSQTQTFKSGAHGQHNFAYFWFLGLHIFAIPFPYSIYFKHLMRLHVNANLYFFLFMPRLKNTLQACRASYTYKNGFVGCLTPDTFICYEIFCDKIVLCPRLPAVKVSYFIMHTRGLKFSYNRTDIAGTKMICNVLKIYR